MASAIIGPMVARIVLAAAAVALAAWFGVTLHWYHLQSSASSAILAAGPRPSPASVDRAVALLKRAEDHNPDVRPHIGEAISLRFGGHFREAAAVAASVLREEPDNIQAAVALVGYLRAYDPAAAAVAARRVRELAPPVRSGP
jgi:hypothetical protein